MNRGQDEQHSFLFRLCGKGVLYPAIPHIYSSVGYCIVYSSWVSHNLQLDKRNNLTLSFCTNQSFEVGDTSYSTMSNIDAKISKSNLSLLIALVALWAGEYYELPILRLVAIHIVIPASIIQIIVLIAYAVDYCMNIRKEHNNQK